MPSAFSLPRGESPRPLPGGRCKDFGRAPPWFDSLLVEVECRLALRSLLPPRSCLSISSTCLCRASMLDALTFAPLSLSARSFNRWTSTSRLSWVTSSAEASERESVSSRPVSLVNSSSASGESTAIRTGPDLSRSWSERSWFEGRGESRALAGSGLLDANCGRKGEKGDMWKFIGNRGAANCASSEVSVVVVSLDAGPPRASVWRRRVTSLCSRIVRSSRCHLFFRFVFSRAWLVPQRPKF